MTALHSPKYSFLSDFFKAFRTASKIVSPSLSISVDRRALGLPLPPFPPPPDSSKTSKVI